MIAALALALTCLFSAGDPLERRPSELPRAQAGRWEGLFQGRELVEEKLPKELFGSLNDAREAYDRGDFPRAIELHYEILEHEPDFPPTLLELGSTYFRLRRYGDAQMCLERFLELAPGQVWRTQVLGHCYYTLGDYEKARAHYARVVAEQPDSVEAVRGLALANYRLGDVESALELLERALELEPDHAEALLWKAQILYESARPEEALAAAERARDADRFAPQALYLLSQILYELGRDEEAEKTQREWKELDRLVQEARSVEGQLLYRPNDFVLAMRLAAIQREIGNSYATGAAFARAIASRPPDVKEVELRIHVLDVLFEMGDTRGAALAAQALAQSCPDEAQAWKRLETYFARIGDAPNQVRAGEKYLRLSGGE